MSGTTDVDWLVVGSGFGGSVAALRLAQKGYSVRVLESGSRFRDEDFAGSTWDARRYFFAPRLGLRGIMRMTLFPDVLIVSGAGVGGGSLGYANTLYRARDAFFQDPRWRDLADWKADLATHYDTAERMLGVTDVTFDSDGDILLRELAAALGVEQTYGHTRVGVYLREPGVEHPDPYFDGEGPARTGCIRCGECMVGCRHGAKNTLVKNYLWFAERLGARIDAERTVTDVRPLAAADGSEGYAVTHVRSGALWRGRGETSTARGVVLAAGALGTNRLLASCRHCGSLPRVSERLGHLVRTNSESIVAVTAPDDARDFGASVAISSSVYPDPETHIELVTYGRGGDAMATLYTTLTGDGTRVTRPLRWLAAVIRRPVRFARTLSPLAWSRRTVIVLVMQTTDAAIRFKAVPKRFRGGVRLATEQDASNPNPTFLPVANRAAEW
ncbi:MAG: FAD-binding protein, partial [Solirubrobacteraceae bacterium]